MKKSNSNNKSFSDISSAQQSRPGEAKRIRVIQTYVYDRPYFARTSLRSDLASLGPRFARRRRNTYVPTHVRSSGWLVVRPSRVPSALHPCPVAPKIKKIPKSPNPKTPKSKNPEIRKMSKTHLFSSNEILFLAVITPLGVPKLNFASDRGILTPPLFFHIKKKSNLQNLKNRNSKNWKI